jgi:UDP-glucose 4-epimerase|tara:strand:- start:42 stop:1046 length:1005 start_codon:yes stop_codon:yes gene_type:complete
MKTQTVLVTGGLGYIGSHTCIALLENNYDLVIIDNLINSNISVLSAIEELTGKNPKFYNFDIRNKDKIKDVLDNNNIDAVIHFAAFKSINESIEEPLLYYDNNVVGVLKLLEALQEEKIYNFIFSSSAAVYGNPSKIPVTEESLRSVTNPYAATKLIAENILLDLAKADDLWKISILRYFNPIGAHSSGLIGEIPDKIPNNLMPYINLVASGHFPYLNVFGGDYNTKDGTAIRDYLHVSDLAESHVAALKGLNFQNGVDAFNIGTGKGISVLELINAFEESNKVKVPYKIIERRIGDSESVFADPSKAIKALKWKAKKNLLQMCEDSWRWQKRR